MLAAIPAASSVADVGAGDGQVAQALANRGATVIATECRLASYARLPAVLERRLGDGLAVLRPGEVDGAVIAGVGGRSIIGMLERGADVARTLRWLVLQPQQHTDNLKTWVRGAGYEVLRETMVSQRGRAYTVLMVRPTG